MRKRSHARDSAGHLRRPKRIHRRGVSLAARCLEDGTLDVNLQTAVVYSKARGKLKRMKTRLDEDGYVKFTLTREATGREKRRTDAAGRRRLVMTVAVARGESRWREHVVDLPGDKDVHHNDTNRQNNAAANLTLEHVSPNRGRHFEAVGVGGEF